VQGLALVPTAYLFLAPAFANMDSSLEEAAITAGAGTFSLLRRVMVPILSPAILSAAIFLLIVSLVVFDVPGVLGIPARIFVMSSQIFYLINNSPGGLPLYGEVSALAILFLGILLALGFAYHRVTRDAQRYRTVTGKGFRPRLFPLGRGRSWALAAIVLYFLLSVVAPLFVLLWMSLMPYQAGMSWAALKLLTLENHRDFISNARFLTAARNSIVVAMVAATAVSLLSLVLSWLTGRLRVPGRQALDLLAFIPIAIPGVMIAVALIYVYIAFGAILPIYGTIWIIAMAYVTQYLPFGARVTGGVMMQLHPEIEEAAATSGAGRLRVFRSITLPLVWPAVAAVWIWVLAHAMRELSSALLLQGRDNKVIPTLLWDYWSGGEPNRTAAGGLWLTAALVVFLVLWRMVSRRAGLERGR
jgi:iron(III) transport system permease protein